MALLAQAPPGIFARSQCPALNVGMWQLPFAPPPGLDEIIVPLAPLQPRRTKRTTRQQTSLKLLSRGSKNHASGQCRPCYASSTPEGCPNGEACNYCHHSHDESRLLQAALFSVKKGLQHVAKPLHDNRTWVESEQSTSVGSSRVSLHGSSGPNSPRLEPDIEPLVTNCLGEPKYVLPVDASTWLIPKL